MCQGPTPGREPDFASVVLHSGKLHRASREALSGKPLFPEAVSMSCLQAAPGNHPAQCLSIASVPGDINLRSIETATRRDVSGSRLLQYVWQYHDLSGGCAVGSYIGQK